MMYAVLFEDDPARSDMRTKLMPSHLDFLERNAAFIHAAGPLNDAATEAAAGGLWVVEADNVQSVQSLIETDPFWPTGLRKSVQILAWTQVFVDGKRQIL